MDNTHYQDKIVVITDASSAFGKGCALELAARGAYVVLAGRDDDLLQELAGDCESAGGRAIAIPTDMAKEGEVQQLALNAVAQFGRIDAWVNNTGSGAVGVFDEIPLAEHVAVIQADLMATLYGSYFAMQRFRRQGSGILINVASVTGKVPAPYMASYVAAKHAVIGLSASLRQELQEAKVETVRVCTVLPAIFDTSFFERAGQYIGRGPTPPPPNYDPKEVVDAIVGLIADPSDETSVGSAAKVSVIAHHLFPGLVESFMAKETHKGEVEKAGG